MEKFMKRSIPEIQKITLDIRVDNSSTSIRWWVNNNNGNLVYPHVAKVVADMPFKTMQKLVGLGTLNPLRKLYSSILAPTCKCNHLVFSKRRHCSIYQCLY